MSTSAHKNKYKNYSLDSQELRRRREEEGIQLRKQKRENALCKRRNLKEGLVMDESSSTPEPKIDIELIPTLTQDIFSGVEERELAAVQMFRKLLSKGLLILSLYIFFFNYIFILPFFTKFLF